MNLYNSFTLLLACGTVAGVRDFYAGWFNKDDLLVAQDTVFKERTFYRRVHAYYSRKLNCPISYYRVLDRLGSGSGPIIRVLRGGLRKQFLSLRITSAYSFPIAVNIYIACQNRLGTGPMFTRPPWTRMPLRNTKANQSTTDDGLTTEAGAGSQEGETTEAATTGKAGEATSGEAGETTPGEAGEATSGEAVETIHGEAGEVTSGMDRETTTNGELQEPVQIDRRIDGIASRGNRRSHQPKETTPDDEVGGRIKITNAKTMLQ